MVFVMSTVYTDQATPLSPPSLPCLIDFENWSIVDGGGVGEKNCCMHHCFVIGVARGL